MRRAINTSVAVLRVLRDLLVFPLRRVLFSASSQFASVTVALCLTTMWSGPASAQIGDSASIAGRAASVVATLAAQAGPNAPGCAVGVAHETKPVYEGAFGLADIEFGVPNTPQTIFESGSVAKQFTAASIVTLAMDGKLNLDDPVRKYIPELPDYGKPLTIRNLLNHTSGIRDWGSVLALTGFGRGDRVISQALALDVIVHQRAVDFTPGAEYSYSNSGYTLLSTIVERISKESLPQFTAEHFFTPLGMTHSTWRTDYTHLVPGRAQAYSRARGEAGAAWKLDMPFMNVYGNGGLLTTVGDWLRWNAMLESKSLGSALVDSMERQGVLNSGRTISYALGLEVTNYKGHRQVAHSGSTAGYQTYLTRFPDLGLSVAVMCNGTAPPATQVALRLVDAIASLPPAPAPDTVTMSAADLEKRVGFWRNVDTHFPAQTVIEKGALRVVGGAVLHPLRDGTFLAAQGPIRWEFTVGSAGKPATAVQYAADAVEHFVVATQWVAKPADLASFAGNWHSAEAGADFALVVDKDELFATQRPETRVALKPLWRDTFQAVGAGFVVWFTRDKTGAVSSMHVGASRMRDMLFTRIRAK